MFTAILENRIHGISFSPYLPGQAPGHEISGKQIRERLDIIAPYCNWVRTFSCREGLQQIPFIAHERGLKAMVGISLGEDEETNLLEFNNGIGVAKRGVADIVAVGNEVLLRGDMREEALLKYIRRARELVPGTPVGYADAYFLFENHPAIADACDVLLINCYPFWESCPIEHAVDYMREMYARAKRVAGDKPVIISETGWPDRGAPFGSAVPGQENALNYFVDTYRWAQGEGIDVFYFSSFDESWKTGDEGDVGAYWGLWDENGYLKHG